MTSLMNQISEGELHTIRAALDAAARDIAHTADIALEHNRDLQFLDRTEIMLRLVGPELCRKLGIFRLPDGFKLSVVMPVYNEIQTLARVIERVRATRLPLEI